MLMSQDQKGSIRHTLVGLNFNLVTPGGTLESAGSEGVKFGCPAALYYASRGAQTQREEVHYRMLSSGLWLAAKHTILHVYTHSLSAEGIAIFPAAHRLLLPLFLLLGLLSESLSFCYVSGSAVGQTCLQSTTGCCCFVLPFFLVSLSDNVFWVSECCCLADCLTTHANTHCVPSSRG